jgi:hypothetical protein
MITDRVCKSPNASKIKGALYGMATYDIVDQLDTKFETTAKTVVMSEGAAQCKHSLKYRRRYYPITNQQSYHVTCFLTNHKTV